jgi:hypothetical protein
MLAPPGATVVVVVLFVAVAAMFCSHIPSNSFNLPLNCRSMKVWKYLSSLQTNVIGSAGLALQMTQIFFANAS